MACGRPPTWRPSAAGSARRSGRARDRRPGRRIRVRPRYNTCAPVPHPTSSTNPGFRPHLPAERSQAADADIPGRSAPTREVELGPVRVGRQLPLARTAQLRSAGRTQRNRLHLSTRGQLTIWAARYWLARNVGKPGGSHLEPPTSSCAAPAVSWVTMLPARLIQSAYQRSTAIARRSGGQSSTTAIATFTSSTPGRNSLCMGTSSA